MTQRNAFPSACVLGLRCRSTQSMRRDPSRIISPVLRIELDRPVSIVVLYATAAATETRGVLFSEDIYGHDRRLAELLENDASAALSQGSAKGRDE